MVLEKEFGFREISIQIPNYWLLHLCHICCFLILSPDCLMLESIRSPFSDLLFPSTLTP